MWGAIEFIISFRFNQLSLQFTFPKSYLISLKYIFDPLIAVSVRFSFGFSVKENRVVSTRYLAP